MVREETGAFVAPPRTGVTRGAINRIGVEGLSLTLPEIRLTTPRLELPSFFHSHAEARMTLDRAEAPYVRTGYQMVGTGRYFETDRDAVDERGAADDRARDEAQPRSTRAADECEEELRRLREKYRQLDEEARRLEALRDCLERCREEYLRAGGAPVRGDGPEEIDRGPAYRTPHQGPPQPPPEKGARHHQFSTRPAAYDDEQISTTTPQQGSVIREPASLRPIIYEPQARIRGLSRMPGESRQP